MTAVLIAVAFAGGYAASIYTWPKLMVFINGAQAEIKIIEDRLAALRAKL